MEKSISQDVLATLVSIENHIYRRWRKCIIVADSLSNFLHDVDHNLNDEDKQQVLRRFLDKETIWDLLPKFARHAKDTKQKLSLLESMEDAYA